MNTTKNKKSTQDKLQKIYNEYKNRTYNDENYYIGGGIAEDAFVSNRHLDARNDYGKLTLGEAVQLFKKATGEDTEVVKEVIEYNLGYALEWHHAGSFRTKGGRKMRRVYFLNAEQICDLALNWERYRENLEKKQNKEVEKENFLKKYAVFVERVEQEPKYFYETKREMYGKYGWFRCENKFYNLPIYYTGYKFRSKKKYVEFCKRFSYNLAYIELYLK